MQAKGLPDYFILKTAVELGNAFDISLWEQLQEIFLVSVKLDKACARKRAGINNQITIDMLQILIEELCKKIHLRKKPIMHVEFHPQANWVLQMKIGEVEVTRWLH